MPSGTGRRLTLLGIGAVQFSKQRRDDHGEIGLHLVYTKVHGHGAEELEDARSL